jgi:hypothetical protein
VSPTQPSFAVKKKRRILFAVVPGLALIALIAVFIAESGGGELPLPPLAPIDEDQRAALLAHLDELGLPPGDYILGKFEDHDVVLLGELHRIRHDPLFVQGLIPRLYNRGIRVLGFEFVNTEDQSDVDRLLAGETYDEKLAIDILRRPGGIWPFQEYVDVLEAVWRLNSGLPPEAERFRLAGLAPRVDFEKLRFGTDEERSEQRRRLSLGDSVYAAVIEREALERGEKMLVYLGRHHAFSRFEQPNLNNKYEFIGSFSQRRAGQRLRAKYPDRVVTVMLHAPFWSPSYRTWILPFGGVIDRVYAEHRSPVGFDVDGSPFAGATDSLSMYALGHGRITLSDFCDGYIVIDSMASYRAVTMVSGWFEGSLFSEFKRRLPRDLPFFVVHPRILIWMLKEDANGMTNRFAALARQLAASESHGGAVE